MGVFYIKMAFHQLYTDIPAPRNFTYPFCYEPNPLCVIAAEELCRYIAGNPTIKEDADNGKMFGVLVVQSAGNGKGFLAAYSGLLAGRNDWEYFVPSVFDSQQPDGYFKTHEAEITEINRRIAATEESEEFLVLKERRDSLIDESVRDIEQYKTLIQKAKEERDKKRQTVLAAEEEAAMIRESQFMKAELRRMKKRWESVINDVDRQLSLFVSEIKALRSQRKAMSDNLQQWLFMQYDMLNAHGERRNLCSIFADTPQGMPPSGAGDCCAPKLLQYAYLNGLKPLCMAEFWWGASPKTEIRHHLHYYPACSGKCKPILGHMLQGLSVDEDPRAKSSNKQVEIVYEDQWLAVVCKPHGMLSVPGKSDATSVLSIMKEKYPDATGPMIVHRLDMDTSGLLVVAKDKDTHERLQAQFANHEIRKRYIALLDTSTRKKGIYNKGVITLPLYSDPLDRPLQKVDYEKGKTAVTEYEVLETTEKYIKVALYPKTGRTHQLRVHCAHSAGLDMPILGDTLYGHAADRLYLHAEQITFCHPATGEDLTFSVSPPDTGFK